MARGRNSSLRGTDQTWVQCRQHQERDPAGQGPRPTRICPPRRREFNANKDAVKDREAFPHIEHLENATEPTPDAGETPPPGPWAEISQCWFTAGGLY